MSIPVRVLLVEDAEDDAILVVDELRDGGFDPVWERVETRGAMHEALNRADWDIVIADYVLPRFSGLAAIELAHDKDPDLPLILISGHLREEEAVNAMRAGARDFISKNRMARLVPAVERELQEAQVRRERRQAREQLRQEQEHRLEFYRSLIFTATNGKLIITDRDEIERIGGPALAEWDVKNVGDLAVVRRGVASVADAQRMDQGQRNRLVLSAGEATTNLIKHAGNGRASIHRIDEALMLVVSDNGPGISAMRLPDVALRMGYSTAGTLGIGYKAILRCADKTYLATGPDGTTLGIEISLAPRQQMTWLAEDISRAGTVCIRRSEQPVG